MKKVNVIIWKTQYFKNIIFSFPVLKEVILFDSSFIVFNDINYVQNSFLFVAEIRGLNHLQTQRKFKEYCLLFNRLILLGIFTHLFEHFHQSWSISPFKPFHFLLFDFSNIQLPNSKQTFHIFLFFWWSINKCSTFDEMRERPEKGKGSEILRTNNQVDESFNEFQSFALLKVFCYLFFVFILFSLRRF